MVNLITLIQRGLNKLVPFSTPGTPLLQDLVHLAAICAALYYAPQIQAYIQDRSRNSSEETPTSPTIQDDTQETLNQADVINEQQPGPPRQAFVEDAGDSDSDSEADDEDFPAFAGADNNNDDPQEGGPAAPGGGGGGGGGPANPRPTGGRTVGAKKAKSLARRDQRRAYHEFMRSQGEAQRARDAAGAEEREAELAREKARRAAAEAGVEAKRAKEREERRVKEEKAREAEMRRRELAVQSVRETLSSSGLCDLEVVARRIGGVDREWVEGLVRASGILSPADGSRVLVTGSGWVVRVERRDMEELYGAALAESTDAHDGNVSYADLAKKLESVLESRITAVR